MVWSTSKVQSAISTTAEVAERNDPEVTEAAQLMILTDSKDNVLPSSSVRDAEEEDSEESMDDEWNEINE